MSDAANTSPKLSQPLSTGGLTTLLVGLCVYLPSEHQQPAILCASFASPLLVHLAFKIFLRISVDGELLKYIASLNRDLKRQRKELKRKNLPSNLRDSLQEMESETVILLARAHQDYASGKLSLKPVKNTALALDGETS